MPFKKRNKERSACRFAMRMNDEERIKLREDADIAGITMSELARRRILLRPVIASVNETMIRELRRVGGLLKLTGNKFAQHPEIVEECVAVLRTLRATIEQVARDDC
jgi:hypothetical protein